MYVLNKYPNQNKEFTMKKKSLIILASTLIMSLSLPLLSYAGEWKEDNIGKWYQNDDGTYPISQWKWIEFNNGGLELCYYFNESGYLVVNATTPDNYTVNENGAWIENGLIMTRPVGSSTESANGSVENNTSQNTSGSLSDYEKGFDQNGDGVLDENELLEKSLLESIDSSHYTQDVPRDWQ